MTNPKRSGDISLCDVGYRAVFIFVEENLKYINAKEVLPNKLIEKLQEYIQGELIYVPMKGKTRAGWGKANGAREKYDLRNNQIIKAYKNGIKVNELSIGYHLSEDSIRKIIRENK